MTFFGYQTGEAVMDRNSALKGTKKMAFSWIASRVGPCPTPGS